MNNNRIGSYVRRALSDQRGQVLPWVAFGMVAFLGMAGLTTDIGNAYVIHSQLQNVTNAAALAGAGSVYNTGSTNNATTVATQYSAGTGGLNTSSSLGTVVTTVSTACVSMLMPAGQPCTTSSVANAIQVKNTASAPTFFLKVLGVNTIPLAATATASMQGIAHPWNVAIIIDSTGSMATQDTNTASCPNGGTEFQCALEGVQTLLSDTPPCPAGVAPCSGSSANFRVSLFTFPNVLTSYNGTAVPSVSDDINCGGTPATWQNYTKQPIAAPYTLPVPGAALNGAPNATSMTYTQTSTGKTWTATYQITPFSSDYVSSTSASGLNPSSDLVKAVGYGSTTGCLTYTFGIWGTGSGSGFGNTYFPGAIYEAQAALAAAQTAYGGNNAIIFLSDGQSNASYYSKNSSAYSGVTQGSDAYEFPSGPVGSEVGPNVSNDPTPAYYTPATSTSSTLGYSTLTGTGLYPDWKDQCQQGIMAAQYAAAAGTRIYSVAYGSEGSGCSSGWIVGKTDTSLVATGNNNVALGSVSAVLPCTTMENIASSLTYFYSDYNQSGSGSSCQSSTNTMTDLNSIFAGISSTFTTPRLIPNSAFPTS